MNIKHLYWKYFGYPDLPPKSYSVNLKNLNRRYNKIALSYLLGDTLEDISKFHNLTRERIRQCIWKVYWNSYKKRE